MPKPVDYNDRVLIVGKTGSGKTVLAQRLIFGMAGARRRAVDPKGLLQLGVEPARDVASIDWSAPIAHYIPSRFDKAEYETLYEALYRAGAPQTIWTDEVGGVGPTKANFAPRYLTAIQAQGRQLGIGHIACTQRPVDIATVLRTECEHMFIFHPLSRIDIDILAREIGTITPDELLAKQASLAEREGIDVGEGLKKYAFLWWHRESGELAECAPLTLPARAPRGAPPAPAGA